MEIVLTTNRKDVNMKMVKANSRVLNDLMQNKTIEHVDHQATNLVVFTFTDGSVVEFNIETEGMHNLPVISVEAAEGVKTYDGYPSLTGYEVDEMTRGLDIAHDSVMLDEAISKGDRAVDFVFDHELQKQAMRYLEENPRAGC